MKKIILSLAVVSSLLFGTDDCVCIKAEGEFGKELMSLLNKYKEKGQIKVIEKPASVTTVAADDKTIGEQVASFFKEKEEKEGVDAIKNKFEMGKNIFNSRCSSCHGNNGEIKAYGRSNLLNSMNETDIEDALIGYQRREYGNGMESVMHPNADALTSTQIKAVAQYIKSLKK